MAKARITFVMEYELSPENYHGAKTDETMLEVEKFYLKEYPETFLRKELIVDKKIELIMNAQL